MIAEEGIIGTTVAEMTEDQHRHDKTVEYFGSLTEFNLDPFLDIGCGNGYITGKVKRALGLCNVYGIDIQRDTLDIPDWLKMEKADFNKDRLPYSDNFFEAIYCGETIEHLINPDNLLGEIKRVLVPGGICLFTTPNLASWYNRIALLLGYQPFCTSVSYFYENLGKMSGVRVYGQRDHVRLFTKVGLVELLEVHGFEIVKVMGWNQGLIGNHLKSSFTSKSAGLIDVIMGKIPSLASRLAVSVTK